MVVKDTSPPRKRTKLSHSSSSPPADELPTLVHVAAIAEGSVSHKPRLPSSDEIMAGIKPLIADLDQRYGGLMSRQIEDMRRRAREMAEEIFNSAAKSPMKRSRAPDAEFPNPTVTQLRNIRELQCIDTELLKRRAATESKDPQTVLHRMVALAQDSDIST